MILRSKTSFATMADDCLGYEPRKTLGVFQPLEMFGYSYPRFLLRLSWPWPNGHTVSTEGTIRLYGWPRSSARKAIRRADFSNWSGGPDKCVSLAC